MQQGVIGKTLSCQGGCIVVLGGVYLARLVFWLTRNTRVSDGMGLRERLRSGYRNSR